MRLAETGDSGSLRSRTAAAIERSADPGSSPKLQPLTWTGPTGLRIPLPTVDARKGNSVAPIDYRTADAGPVSWIVWSESTRSSGIRIERLGAVTKQ